MRREEPDTGDSGQIVIGWIGLAAAPVLLGLSLLQWLHYDSPSAALAAVLCVPLLLVSPWVHRVRIPTLHYICLVGFLAIGGASFARGGVLFPILVWSVIPCVVCLLLHRLRAAIGWIIAILPLWLVLHVLESSGLTPPRVEANMVGALVGTVTALLGASIVVFVQERRRRIEIERRLDMERAMQEANKLEGIARLAGGVAHDFNNLLAIVKSRAQVIASELGRDHELSQDAAAIEKAVDAGADLTRRLLAIGREAGPVSPRPIDLNHSATEMEKLLHKALPDEVTLRCALAHEPVVIEADPRQIEQVVMNLVLNARDAMPKGGHITIRTGVQALAEAVPLRGGEVPAGRYACLTVEDDGEGIRDDVLDHVFEPFFTTKEYDRGTGLGLAVVFGLATTLRGHVDVESTLGEGSTFRLWFPLLERAAVKPNDESEPAVACPPATILVVDDEPAVRRATARLLRLDGHEVLVADGGAEALALSGSHDGDIDILLTDVSMPEMSGWDVAKELREQRPDVAVIYFSGTDGLRGDDAGDREVFLPKPVSRAALSRAILALVRVRDLR